MDVLSAGYRHQTIQVRCVGDICHLRIDRPDANNTINDTLIDECAAVLVACEPSIRIVVVEGLPHVFCFGADLHGLRQSGTMQPPAPQQAEKIYRLWLQLKRGPFVSVAHVRGKANAGGVGFAAACDLVLCEERASFSLSELLFGLIPACVMPFLIERIGHARANAMTLMTQPVGAHQALGWGLVDACAEDSDELLRIHLLRLRLLPKDGIVRHKRYIAALNNHLESSLPAAVACNRDAFSDAANLTRIDRFLSTGLLPWQAEPA